MPSGTSAAVASPVMSRPASAMLPPEIFVSAKIDLSNVDLPAPFGPTMTPMSDCSMAMLTPLRMGAPP